MIKKVISGGQTGADMGGLLAARAAGISTGGWAPEGWQTERGPRPELESFGLRILRKLSYWDCTRRNVMDSDCTLVLARVVNSPGTRLTIGYCDYYNRPAMVIRLLSGSDANRVLTSAWKWLRDVRSREGHDLILNVAGNRESKAPGLQKDVEIFLTALFLKTEWDA